MDADEPAQTPEKKRKGGRGGRNAQKFPPHVRLEIRADYEANVLSVKEICEKWGVPEYLLRTWKGRDKWMPRSTTDAAHKAAVIEYEKQHGSLEQVAAERSKFSNQLRRISFEVLAQLEEKVKAGEFQIENAKELKEFIAAIDQAFGPAPEEKKPAQPLTQNNFFGLGEAAFPGQVRPIEVE